MRTLWTFGGSNTDTFEPKDDWRKEYVDWKGYIPKVYGEIISEKLNYKLQNISVQGACNYTIFQNVCDNIDKIQNDDIVIIGWTVIHRFRIVDNDNWKSIVPQSYQNSIGLSNNALESILVNRTHPLYTKEVNSWIKLINFALPNNKVIHWSWWKNDELNASIYDGFENIYIETKGKVNNGHWSEKGQIDLSNLLLKEISGINKLI